jgi:hypothetical protein
MYQSITVPEITFFENYQSITVAEIAIFENLVSLKIPMSYN